MLTGEGYRVVEVPSAEEALAAIGREHPSLIITDVKLSGLDGFTMFEELRKDPALAPIPCLFITGYNDLHAIETAKRLGAAGYITKPYNIEDLISLVANLLPPPATKAAGN